MLYDNFVRLIPCPSCKNPQGGVEVYTERPNPVNVERQNKNVRALIDHLNAGTPREGRPPTLEYDPNIETVVATKLCWECTETRLKLTTEIDILHTLWADTVALDDKVCRSPFFTGREDAKIAWTVLLDAIEENAGTENTLYRDAVWCLNRWNEPNVAPLTSSWLRSI